MKKLFVISILILISFFLIVNLGEESMESRIVSNDFLYTTTTYKADEVLAFTIIPNDYLKQSKLGQRRLLMDTYDSKVYLEPLIDNGDEYWVGWSFDNNWYKREGTVFTFRSLLGNGL